MNWQPTREQLALAALACGVKGEWSDTFPNPPKGEPMFIRMGGGMWQPHLPTTQGKADLVDLMEAIPLGVLWCFNDDGSYKSVFVSYDAFHKSLVASEEVLITNGNKHAALAKAAITVGAQVGAKMKGETKC